MGKRIDPAKSWLKCFFQISFDRGFKSTVWTIGWYHAKGMRETNSQTNQRKKKEMAAKTGSGFPEENEFGFEFIEESEMESVKRGRKAQVIPEMVQFFAKAKVGQIVKVNYFAIDTEKASAEEVKLAKAKNAATIRSHAKASGWSKVQISWSPKGVPQVKRIA